MTRPYRWTKGARPLKERILAKVVEEDRGFSTPCWAWKGATHSVRKSAPEGYGCLMTGSRQDGSRKVRSAHVVAYEEWIGPIPKGLEIDHLCHQTICCNPDHLEPVTHRENLSLARVRPGAWASRQKQLS